MTIEIDIIRKVQCSMVFDEFVREVIQQTIAQSGARIVNSAHISVDVVFVDDIHITQLNKQYRGKDVPTDILSFPDAFPDAIAHRAEQLRKMMISGDVFLGELIVDCAYITKYATMDKVEPLREFAFVIAHGVLHLLGYDHGERMFEIQDIATVQIMSTIRKFSKS